MKLVAKHTVAFKNLSIQGVCERVAANKDVVLLDVRTEGEFNGKDKGKYGRLKNAINIPVDELKARIAELDKYKNKEIIVYCSHSRRSPRASQLLTENGFTNVSNMLGGMSEWDATRGLTCKESLIVR
jgi:rhodanese-related sulfurtransferase